MVRVILWNRNRDTFKPGPWFKGRLFAHCSDLSPDGRHMIYFAMGGVKWAVPATGGTWTAISRPPSLTATALWGQGGGTRGGGGMFISNTSYWLDANFDTFLVRDDGLLRRSGIRPARSRAEREGWTAKSDRVSEKTLPEGWVLRRITRHAKPDRHEVEQSEAGLKLSFPTWEWADWDRKRLVWAESGCLRAAKLGSRGLGKACTLQDFSAMKPPGAEM